VRLSEQQLSFHQIHVALDHPLRTRTPNP
jgi:hypothetical protein